MDGQLTRRRFLGRAGLAAGALAGGALLSACAPGSAPAPTPGNAATLPSSSGTPATAPAAARRSERLTLSWWTDIGYPSPFAFIPLGPGGVIRVSLLFDTLTWKDERGIIPWLAERWEVTGDGLDYTFRLRPDIAWHDGRQLTGDDVAFSFAYYQQHPFKWGVGDMIERAEAIDVRTVRIRLNRPFAPFLENIAGIFPILPSHIWESVSDPLKHQTPDAIGSGPYKLTSYKEGKGEYLLTAHDAYFRGRPLVDAIGYVLVPQAQRVVGLQTHAADAILSTDYDVVQTFGQGPDYRALQTPPFSIVRLLFNVDRPPFDQRDFRRAIAHALDRQQIGERVIHGNVVVGSPGVVPPGSPWHNPAVPQYPHDPARARALLDGLGYRAGGRDGLRATPQGQPLVLELLTDPAMADSEIVRLMLREVGLEVKLVAADSKTRTELLQQRRYSLALSAHIGVGGDPDYLRRWYANQAYNAFEYGNVLHSDEFTRLADQQVAELDPTRRKSLVDRMQVVLAEELSTLPLYHRPFYWMYDPARWDRWFNTHGGLMDGIPLMDNKLAFL